jgi:DNA topoisomerase-1
VGEAARGSADDPAAQARSAGLVHVSDALPGIERLRRGESFVYRANGRIVRDAAELARIRRLAVPPAWGEVWICARADGHLQATGRDARGRKQYRYHARWREVRDETKFERLEAFGAALPAIRERVERDLCATALTRSQVLATVVRLLDTTLVRVGNDEYARDNGSYGLTTLENRHAGVRGNRLTLAFRGKSGVAHSVAVDDARLARIVRKLQQLPGQELFQYRDADGEPCGIGSADVNDYLCEAARGERYTAKDFRTWHGSVQALELLGAGDAAGAVQIVAEVARRLRNTPAVCRKAYIHPAVLELALGSGAAAQEALKRLAGARPRRALSAAEARLLRLLAQVRRCGARKLGDALEYSLRRRMKA